MMILHMIGATIPQAAAMVARLSPALKTNTLADRYRRSGYGKIALRERPLVLQRWHLTEIEKLLADYPDTGIELKQGKTAIRAMYSKHHP
jgi:hypothetical protein